MLPRYCIAVQLVVHQNEQVAHARVSGDSDAPRLLLLQGSYTSQNQVPWAT
jgi:hypothetical protein